MVPDIPDKFKIGSVLTVNRDYLLWDLGRRASHKSGTVDTLKAGEAFMVLEEPVSFLMNTEDTNWILTVVVLGPRCKGKIELFFRDAKDFVELPD